MSLTKKYLKSKPVCKVTFKLLKEQCNAADKVEIAGDFNDWSNEPMKKLKSGDFTLTVDLYKDQEYQFRYLLDGKEWENDWEADNYVPSPISLDDNSVVSV